jgi:hypothetical protein
MATNDSSIRSVTRISRVVDGIPDVSNDLEGSEPVSCC